MGMEVGMQGGMGMRVGPGPGTVGGQRQPGAPAASPRPPHPRTRPAAGEAPPPLAPASLCASPVTAAEAELPGSPAAPPSGSPGGGAAGPAAAAALPRAARRGGAPAPVSPRSTGPGRPRRPPARRYRCAGGPSAELGRGR